MVPSLPSRNQTLAIAVKKHAKVDMKLLLSCPVLLDFSILFQIFCAGLQVFFEYYDYVFSSLDIMNYLYIN